MLLRLVQIDAFADQVLRGNPAAVMEVDLCGHATLATAGHLFDDVHPDGRRISFWTRSGWLHIRRGDQDGELVMDFPAEPSTALAKLPLRGVAVTSPGDGDEDFVSRWFGARSGIAEDPVTGSSHSQLAPYWAQRLGRARLTGRQLSARGGTVGCEVDGDRIHLSGTYRRYLDGTATVPDGDLSARR